MFHVSAINGLRCLDLELGHPKLISEHCKIQISITYFFRILNADADVVGVGGRPLFGQDLRGDLYLHLC